jgi:methionyl-tRNA formyltransferase
MEKNQLRIVFMGTPEIAVASLDAIRSAGYHIAGVITAPDKPAGRGQKLQVSPVKEYSILHGLNLLQPANLKDPEFLNQLKDLHPHVQVVVAFRMLPEAIWSLPPMGTFNMHASLLPAYRGAAPINWAIINGESRTGVTTFFLDKEIDTGKIILQKETPVYPHDTAGTLHDRLMEMGADIVIETLENIRLQKVTAVDQKDLMVEDGQLKKAPKIFREDCRINWNEPAEKICNRIKGLNPFPGAFTELPSAGELFMMKILEARPLSEKHTHQPGTLFTDNKNYIKISTSDGFVEVKNLQAAGKKRMKTEEFLRGYSFSDAPALK